MADEKKEYKSSTELALELYPAVKAVSDAEPPFRKEALVEALYLLMQMVDGPATAGRVIRFTQVR